MVRASAYLPSALRKAASFGRSPRRAWSHSARRSSQCWSKGLIGEPRNEPGHHRSLDKSRQRPSDSSRLIREAGRSTPERRDIVEHLTVLVRLRRSVDAANVQAECARQEILEAQELLERIRRERF